MTKILESEFVELEFKQILIKFLFKVCKELKGTKENEIDKKLKEILNNLSESQF